MSQHYPYPAPPRRRVWPWVLGGIMAFILVAFVGCTALFASAASSVSQAASKSVVYEVDGAGGAMITYTTKSGTSQEGNAKTPWTKTVEGGFLGGSLSAQRKSGNNGEITCRVKDDTGKVLAENTSSGPYAVCTAAGF